jgi:Protein kinase domain
MSDRIGKYTITKVLGQGGFGKVYLAFDPDVGQPVAIKMMLAGGDPDLRRFQLEIRTTASLRHKNIVTIHASGEEDGNPYLVMEFLEGRTLKQIIHERHPLSLLDKVRIMTQVAEGLGYANSNGVVHRDVKPENIMLLRDDTVKIMDFGIALGPNRNTAVTATGGIIGTPPYFAPEQLQGQKATEQSDIFSYGDVYYELLTGVHPFEQYKSDWKALQIAIARYAPAPIRDLLPCPEALENLVQRALVKEPEFRYRTFEEIRLDSEAILADLRHESSAAGLRSANALLESGNLREALEEINQAFQMDPRDREIRQKREEIKRKVDEEQVQKRTGQALSDAERYMRERRYAEAVENLEFAARLDPANVVVAARLAEAQSWLDRYTRANRLVAEARYLQQKALPEALGRVEEALELYPPHTEALRLQHRYREELELRRREQATRASQDLRAAKQFGEALLELESFEKKYPGDAEIASLRAEIEKERAEEEGRVREERLNLAIAKTREEMQKGNLTLARRMLEHLDVNFASHPGAPGPLRDLHEQFEALARAAAVSNYQQRVRGFSKEKAFAEALELLGDALAEFPGEAGLERLRIEIEQQRYADALEKLLKDARERMAAGDYHGVIDLLENAVQFSGEAEWRGLVTSARSAAAAAEEQRFSAHALALAAEFESRKEWNAALDAVEKGLARYPHNSSLTQRAGFLRGHVKQEDRRVAIERRRTQIALEIDSADSKRAELSIGKARAEFPGDPAFDDLARHVESSVYEEGWRQVDARARRQLAANSLPVAERDLDDPKTRSTYAKDPRWQSLRQELVERRRYEDALAEAGRLGSQGRLSEAGQLLTELINRGAFDQRAAQMRDAIRAQHSKRERQSEIASLAEAIRERLHKGELERAAPELAAARVRYPGESVWGQLQTELDAMQQSLWRHADILAAEQAIRLAMDRADIEGAATLLIAAREKYPNERAWAALQAEIEARRALPNPEDRYTERRVQSQSDPPARVLSPATAKPALLVTVGRRPLVFVAAAVLVAGGVVVTTMVHRSQPTQTVAEHAPGNRTAVPKPPEKKTEIAAPPSIVSFAAEPAALQAGQFSRLHWAVSGVARRVSIAPEIGEVDASGSRPISPAKSVTFTLTAEGPGGTVSSTVDVRVSVSALPAPPSVDLFVAEPNSIQRGQTATLRWTVVGNATRVSIAPGIGTVPATGEHLISPGGKLTYTLTAAGPGGSTSSSVTVSVSTPASASPVIEAFSADPQVIRAGESATLQWDVRGEGVTVSIHPGTGNLPPKGISRVAPRSTVTYELTAHGAGGSVSREVTLEVKVPTPVPPADPVGKEREAILQTLAAYSKAVENKDEEAIRSVWPTIPASVMNTWKNDFQSARAITMDLRPTAPIAPLNGSVRVECAMKLHREYASSQPYNSEVVTRFTLRQESGRWVIESIR